jgi:hypothetical protein
MKPSYRQGASRPISRVLYGRGSSPRRDGHSSGTPVAGRLKQPTRATGPTDKAPRRLKAPRVAPIRFCSRRGLPCRRRCRPRGALLPHPFTLAVTRLSLAARDPAVCFLWRFPWGFPRRTLSGAVSAWSPDFPPLRSGGRPADWLTRAYGPSQRRSSGIERGEPRTASNQPRGSFIAASLELWKRGAAGGERCAAALRLWAIKAATKRTC